MLRCQTTFSSQDNAACSIPPLPAWHRLMGWLVGETDGCRCCCHSPIAIPMPQRSRGGGGGLFLSYPTSCWTKRLVQTCHRNCIVCALGRWRSGSFDVMAELPPASRSAVSDREGGLAPGTPGIRFRFSRRDPQLVDSWDFQPIGSPFFAAARREQTRSCVLGWGNNPPARDFLFSGLRSSALRPVLCKTNLSHRLNKPRRNRAQAARLEHESSSLGPAPTARRQSPARRKLASSLGFSFFGRPRLPPWAKCGGAKKNCFSAF